MYVNVCVCVYNIHRINCETVRLETKEKEGDIATSSNSYCLNKKKEEKPQAINITKN